jgi:hypothetical protein
MQRSAGLLRTEISAILTAHYAAGKPYTPKYLAEVLQAAVARLNNREIVYAIPEDILQRTIRNKAGRLIYAVNIAQQWYLFAGGETAVTSEELLRKSIENSGVAKNDEEITEYMRRAQGLGPLSAKTVITVINKDNIAIREHDGKFEVDLNKILGINPKAVFTGEAVDAGAAPLQPGRLLQGVLSGLSLAGSVIAWDGKASLRELIVIADILADNAKDQSNKKTILGVNPQQETLVDFEGKISWKDQNMVAITFGIR